MTLDKISDKLFEAKRIAIFTHISPDCDAFGSMFALYEGLKQMGKKCSMFVDGKLNKFEEAIFDVSKVNSVDFVPSKYDTLIAVDCADAKRLGKFGDAFLNFQNTYKIDHHKNRDSYAKNIYVEHDSSSCCEIIYDLLNKLRVTIDKKISTYLYAGIATDSNSFINTNTTARTYKIAEKLFEKGADTIKINKQCFRTVSKESISLMKLFYNKMKFVGDVFGYVIINNKEFKKTKTTYLETSNFGNLICSIEGIKIGCCVTEREGSFSLSFRSAPGVRIDELAQTLGGGGHPEAAGARISENEKKVEKLLVQTVKKYLGIKWWQALLYWLINQEG